jgi:hypothetical protein
MVGRSLGISVGASQLRAAFYTIRSISSRRERAPRPRADSPEIDRITKA